MCSLGINCIHSIVHLSPLLISKTFSITPEGNYITLLCYKFLFLQPLTTNNNLLSSSMNLPRYFI